MLSDMERVLEDSARGGFYLTLGNIISTIVSALSIFIIARILGSEQYGLYTISTVIPSLLLLVVNPGITQGIIKYSASLQTKGEKDRIPKLLIHALLFKTTLALIATIACFTLSDQFARHILKRPEVTWYNQIASTIIILQTIYVTVNSAFIGLDKTEFNTLTTTIQAVIKAIIAPILIIIGLSITGALTGYVLSFLIASLIGMYLFIFKIYKPLDNSSKNNEKISSNLKMLIRYGFPLYVSALIGGFAAQYQNILLSIFTTNQEIGNYKAAMNFTVLVTSVAVPIATTLLPAFSKLENHEKQTREFFKMAVKYTSMIVLPLAIILMLYAKEIVQLMYGEDYASASTYLTMYAIQFLLVGLGSLVLGSFFSGLGATKINLRISLTNSIIIVALAPILTWLLKINGMIITVTLASLASTLYALHIAKSKFKLGLNAGTTTKIYIASAISAIPVLVFQKISLNSYIIQVMIGTAIYLTTYLLLVPTIRIISQPELAEMRKIVERIKPLRILTKPLFYCEQRILSRTT